MRVIQSIQNKRYEVRGHRVMPDRDPAALYEVETRSLNLSVKRNIRRFPEDFMFQLTIEEWELLRLQIETSKTADAIRSQSATLKLINAGHGGSRYLPYVFTGQGVAMLSGILHSGRAIAMNIPIMRAFVELRKVLMDHSDVKEQLYLLQSRIGGRDSQLNGIYDAIENLPDEKAAQLKRDDRERIGFRK